MALSWDQNPEPDVAGYILRYGLVSGSLTVATNVGTLTSHAVTGLAPGVTYYFAVAAYNAAGQEGERSDEISYTPPLVPNVISGLVVVPAPASVGSHQIALAWNLDPAPNLIGYVLRYGLASGSHIVATNVGNVTSHVVHGLAAGVTYYFVVSPYNAAGQEGERSNEATYTPPFRLNVKSAGLAFVPIVIETIDQQGAGGGKTPLVRVYPPAARVTLRAPDTSEGWKFVRWLRNGLNLTTQKRITLSLGTEFELTAVYADDSLLAHWPLDESAGPTAFDASGHGQQAQLNQGASWGAGHESAGSLRVESGGDCLLLEDSTSVDFSGDFTLAMWLQTTQTTRQTLIQKRAAETEGAFILSLSRKEQLQGALSLFDGSQSWLDSRGRNLTDGAWHHVAVTRSGNILRIYRDGTPDSFFVQPLAYRSGSNPLNFGVFFSGSGSALWGLRGHLDDIRYYNRALTPGQIASLGPVPTLGGGYSDRISPLLRLDVQRVENLLHLAVRNNDGSPLTNLEQLDILWSDSLGQPIEQWTLLGTPLPPTGILAVQIFPDSHRFFFIRQRHDN